MVSFFGRDRSHIFWFTFAKWLKNLETGCNSQQLRQCIVSRDVNDTMNTSLLLWRLYWNRVPTGGFLSQVIVRVSSGGEGFQCGHWVLDRSHCGPYVTINQSISINQFI